MSDPPGIAGVTHAYVDAGGLRTHAAIAGPRDAPPVLLVHGWPEHWWCWRRVIRELAAERRVIAPDLRGFGWSDAPRAGYAKEQLASDLLALLDALRLERVTWVGHDWGGWVGQLAALRAPDRLERLLVLGVPHLWVAPHPRELALLGYQGPLSLPLVGPLCAARMVPSILQAGRGRDPLPPSDVRLFAEHVPARVSTAMYRTFLTRELIPILRGRYAHAHLSVPTEIIAGARDLVTRGLRPGPVEGHPELHVEVLDGMGHWLPEQRPDAVAAWVLRR
jgi:pimeloyl-ACP methyl ester carboxylesterase